ncbi:MAG TPA: hypothetical protein VNS10_07560 [Gemmatimonadaceae bacterium]|jgi:hypothetical protein|nr:hypothetical protein [Gemmatimonadaceae bacterium]
MPTNKDFKRVVRARMRKTGESYTAARAQLLRETPAPRAKQPPKRRTARPTPPSSIVPPAQYAGVAGMSDAAVKEGTGCTWERWVNSLDYHQAYTWSHRDIAKYLREKYKTPSWWTQMVTVGYERIKGLRAPGQQRSGSYTVTRSKTVRAPLTALFAAFENDEQRARWLPSAQLKRATKNKSLRLLLDDGSQVVAGFTSKGDGKSQVAVEQTGLANSAAAAECKSAWSSRLENLAAQLSA